MRTSERFIAIFITSFLTYSFAFAEAKQNNPPPRPLSGLNLEDFQSATKTKIEWESNPFVKYGDSLQAKQLLLLGIVFGHGRSMALINSEIVRVGDRVGSSEVVAIEKQKVVLRNEDGLYEISFRGATNEKT